MKHTETGRARGRLEAVRRTISNLRGDRDGDADTATQVDNHLTLSEVLCQEPPQRQVEALCMEIIHAEVWTSPDESHIAGCVAGVIAGMYADACRKEMQAATAGVAQDGDEPDWTAAVGRVVGLDAKSAEELFHAHHAPKRLLALTAHDVSAAIGRLLDGTPPNRIWVGERHRA